MEEKKYGQNGQTNFNTSKENKENEENRMTREQAGHKGGAAPHECRGRECDEKGKKK